MSDINTTDQHICEEMVTKIAKLARLRLTQEEAGEYRANFKDLMLLFHELDSLDVSQNITTDLRLINASDCREDIVNIPDNTHLADASAHYNETSCYFDVPQFIEYDDE